MFCPNCGMNNAAEKKFCTNCGTNLAAVSDALEGRAAPTDSHPTAEAGARYHRPVARAITKGATGFGLLIGALIFIVNHDPFRSDGQVWIAIGLAVASLTFLGWGLGSYYEALAARREAGTAAQPKAPPTRPPLSAAGPAAPPPSGLTTSSLPPPSTAEATTQHLPHQAEPR